jgi:hypothetical protein
MKRKERREVSPSEARDRSVNIRIWLHVIAGAALMLLVGGLIYAGCSMRWSHARICATFWNSPPWALFSGLAAAPALIHLWQLRTNRRDAELDKRAEELSQARDAHELSQFIDCLKLLGDAKMDLRIGAIHSLEELARTSPVHAHPITKTLSAYVSVHVERNRDTGYIGKNDDTFDDRPLVDDVSVALFALARLGGAQLELAKLSRANLSLACLQRVNLQVADLREADLRGAVLTGSNMSRAILRSANLGMALLDNADLREADLEGAILFRARLQGANLAKAVLRDADLDKATFDGLTVFPEGFDPDSSGMVRGTDPRSTM